MNPAAGFLGARQEPKAPACDALAAQAATPAVAAGSPAPLIPALEALGRDLPPAPEAATPDETIDLPLPDVDESAFGGLQRMYRHGMKQALDVVFGSILLVILSPIIGLAWLAVRLTSEGPGFFVQDRVGLGGKLVPILKLRTMYTNHHDRIDMEKVREHEARGLLVKFEQDPRITPIGAILRKTSIDELPQLWNVVKGHMSLVGPRPLMPHMVAPYPEINAIRCKTRPGITGEWQVSARDENTSLACMVNHDLHYVANYSFWMDLRILLKTLLVVATTKGAH